MRAGSTASGARTSGSTAPQKDATRQPTGGASMTSMTRAERSRGSRSTRRRAERVEDAHLSVDPHPVLHVLRPQGIAAGLQGRRKHQGIKEREAVLFGEPKGSSIGLQIDRENVRADGADRGERIADFVRRLAKLAARDIG